MKQKLRGSIEAHGPCIVLLKNWSVTCSLFWHESFQGYGTNRLPKAGFDWIDLKVIFQGRKGLNLPLFSNFDTYCPFIQNLLSNYIPEIWFFFGVLCFWLRHRLRRHYRRTPTLVQTITLSHKYTNQIHIRLSHWGPRLQESYDFWHQSEKQNGLWRLFCIKNAQKACGVSNCVTNSPINFIFGIAIDNT